MNGQVQVKYTRGGREVRTRAFSFAELANTSLSQALDADGVTAGLNGGFELYVREQESDSEVAVGSQQAEATLESILRGAAENGEIDGKMFIFDCTAEHRGAGTASSLRAAGGAEK